MALDNRARVRWRVADIGMAIVGRLREENQGKWRFRVDRVFGRYFHLFIFEIAFWQMGFTLVGVKAHKLFKQQHVNKTKLLFMNTSKRMKIFITHKLPSTSVATRTKKIYKNYKSVPKTHKIILSNQRKHVFL